MKITITSQARRLAKQQIKRFKINIHAIKLGLPEYDDRTKDWRVPLVRNEKSVGFFYFLASNGNFRPRKSASKKIILSRIKNSSHFKKHKKRHKKDNTYYISHLPNMLINGDCRNVLKKLPDNSVDLVFTSPPYYNARPEYSDYDSYQDYLKFIKSVIHEVKRVLIPGKFFVMDSSPVLIPRIDREHSSTRIGVPFDIHHLFMEENFEFMDDIIWEKPEGAGWASGRGRRFAADRNPMQYKPVPVTENIMVYRKKSDHLIDWFIRKHPNQKLVQDSKINGDYEKTNIWRMSPARDKRHPAIFPIGLAKRVIRYYSFKNDVVLDPFGGLATTGKAALELGRRFINIESNKKFFNDALDDFNKKYALYMQNIKIIKDNK